MDSERPIKGISGLGDINVDDRSDFAVVSDDLLVIYSYDNVENQFGLFTISADTNQEGFGTLSNANRLNNDNFNDFAIGVSRWPTLPRGAIHIVYGQNNTVIEIKDTIVTTDSNSNFGEGKIAIIENFFGKDRNLLACGYSWIENIGLMGFVDFYTNDVFSVVNQNKDITLKHFRLFANFPNPFNPSTNIEFQLPKDANVVVKVYDIQGNEVQKLVNEYLSAGYYSVLFDGSNLSSGVYIYTIQMNDFHSIKKMMLIK